jgi:nicotinamide-nucleotide amidase
MKVDLIATGSELLHGEIVDTNTPFIASELKKIGFKIAYQHTVGDILEDVEMALKLALGRSGVVIITGGLGPTTDDITRIAVTKVLDKQLSLHLPSVEKIKDFFRIRGLEMPESNLQQAYFPPDSIILENQYGTAPGAIIETNNALVIMLPGPPNEMRPMFLQQVIPFILKYFHHLGEIKGSNLRKLRLAGIGESKAQDIIKKLDIDEEITIAYQALFGEIIIKLWAENTGASKKLEEAVRVIQQELANYIYGLGDVSLESVVSQQLLNRKMKLGIAESCTGGLLCHKLTNIPGSSGFLTHGIVSYSKDAKASLLQVQLDTLDRYTAVSKETALEMAEGIRILDADIGISITGYAGNIVSDGLLGPSQNQENPEPTGLVYIGIADKQTTQAFEYRFIGSRLTIKERAAQAALIILWRYLSK